LARLFIVSNRVSVPAAGVRRAGGLEVALRATLDRHECIWFGWSGNVRPKEAVGTETIAQGKTTYIVTDLSTEDYQAYYNGFANQVLWPILHYRLDLAEFSRRDLSGYLRVNDHFAEELAKVLKKDDLVWVHDYHHLTLARALRNRGLTNKLGFFLHIPLPPPDILTALPNHEKLIPALTDYDLVGFQTNNDAINFARYLAAECGFPHHLPARQEPGAGAMRIGVFPVGIATDDFAKRAKSSADSDLVARVRKSVPGALMIGVDRLDYSKGIVHRLAGVEAFLAANEEFRGKVTYLQITPQSRDEIPEYIEIKHRIESMVGEINAGYGDAYWLPVRYINRTYGRSALAGLYRIARVGLVTPLRDGMNLVAKEYVAAQEADDPGVLILSRFAGAAAEMKAALLVNPYDAESVGGAIARALYMPRKERVDRHRDLYKGLKKTDIANWGDRFIAQLSGKEAVEPLSSSIESLPLIEAGRVLAEKNAPRPAPGRA
jgi:trehalose 6-phosphate synthase